MQSPGAEGGAAAAAPADPAQMPSLPTDADFPADVFSPEQAQAILESINSLAERASKVAVSLPIVVSLPDV